MKKTLATIITVGSLVASSYAQGTVDFKNAAASVVKQWTTLTDPTPINIAVGGGRVELLWAVVGTTDLNLFASATPTAVGFVAPGRFAGGAVTVPTTVAGGPVALVVRGWTGSSLTWGGLTDLDQRGYSAIWTQSATGNPNTVPPGTPASITPGLTGFTVVPVPEPSSMVLAGLGAASLLLFRRRK